MDLESTLIRAKSLFRRFQRTIETVDKKSNFPSPSVRQRKPVEGPKSPTARSSATEDTSQNGLAKEKIVTPELRTLLSRKIEILRKKDLKDP